MEVKSISQKIFRTRSEKAQDCEKIQSNHTNPFGVNFKGNIIKMDAIKNADVFDSSLKSELVNRVSGKFNKLKDAMNIGSINSYLSKRLDPVMNLGRKIKTGAQTVLNNLNETMLRLGVGKGEDNKLNISFGIKNYSVNHKKKQSIEVLKDDFINTVNAYIAERAAA